MGKALWDTMPAIRQDDFRAILDFVREAESFPDVDSFRHGVLPGLRRLVPCDAVGYNEVDAERGRSVVIGEPQEAFFDEAEGLLTRLAHEHPVVIRAQAGDLRTYTISDFLTTRQFHGLALYNDIYRRMGAEDQIAFGLPGQIVVGIAMNRDRRSFSRRDREVLEILRPHLAQAWRHVLARGRAQELVRALEEGLEVAGGAVLVLDGRRGFAQSAGPAGDLLEAYFGVRATLPGLLAEWVGSTPGSSPLAVDGPRGRLLVRVLSPTLADRQPVLLLEEVRRVAPEPKALEALGLTRREAQVLRLVAIGKPNAEIGDELGISPATVRKHLERIYPKLGVSTRAAAAARAMGV